MRIRLAWLIWCCCLGCQATHDMVVAPELAHPFWEKGQQAMGAGRVDEAIGWYQEELRQQHPASRSYLSLAAAYVAKGEEAAATLTLAHFVEANPDQRNARFYYAELLRRTGKLSEAQYQFERTVAHLQDEATSEYAQLVHCHGRLMEIAENLEDDYQVHLHRGIGLYWLALGSQAAASEHAELTPEGLLCKAAGELCLARELRPHEARPAWYLYSIWHNLAQTPLARRWLGDAREAAPFSYLTPGEQRGLQMASAPRR